MDDKVSQFNSLLDKFAESSNCGPECTKLKKLLELKKKYLETQTNLITAPQQYMSAKKNYFIYSEGESKYNDMIENELRTKSIEIGKVLTNNFIESANEVINKNEDYNSLYLSSSHIVELYKDYLQENFLLEKEIKELTSDTITNERKTYYEDQGITTLHAWYKLFMWIYVFVSIITIVFMLLPSTREKFGIMSAITTSIFIILYPFIINIIIYWIVNKLNTISDKVIPQNAYLDKKYKDLFF